VLKGLDVFEEQKHKTFMDSERAILSLMEYLHKVTEKLKSSQDVNRRDIFGEFIQVRTDKVIKIDAPTTSC